MATNDVLKLMKDKQIEYVDLRFTDPRGKLQHLTMDATIVDNEMLNGSWTDICKRHWTGYWKLIVEEKH